MKNLIICPKRIKKWFEKSVLNTHIDVNYNAFAHIIFMIFFREGSHCTLVRTQKIIIFEKFEGGLHPM